MKLVRENINEAVKHLSGRTPEEIRDFYKNAKMAYYHVDTDEFEYKGKKRVYNVTSDVVKFLKSKDYLIYKENNEPKGIIGASMMSSWILCGYRNIYQDIKQYRPLTNIVYNFLIQESIKHLRGPKIEDLHPGLEVKKLI